MFTSTAEKVVSAGTLAIDADQVGRWGWAADYPALEDAERRALAECGEGRWVVTRFTEGCAAYAADRAAGSSAAVWASEHDAADEARDLRAERAWVRA